MNRIITLVAAFVISAAAVACSDTTETVPDADISDTAPSDTGEDATVEPPTMRELGIFTPDDPEWDELSMGEGPLDDVDIFPDSGSVVAANGWQQPSTIEDPADPIIRRASDQEVFRCHGARAVAHGGLGCIDLDRFGAWECGCEDSREWYLSCSGDGLTAIFHRSAQVSRSGSAYACFNP